MAEDKLEKKPGEEPEEKAPETVSGAPEKDGEAPAGEAEKTGNTPQGEKPAEESAAPKAEEKPPEPELGATVQFTIPPKMLTQELPDLDEEEPEPTGKAGKKGAAKKGKGKAAGKEGRSLVDRINRDGGKDKKKTKVESEQARLKKEEQTRRSRRRNRQLIGFAVSVLVIVGAVSIVMGSVNLVSGFLDTSGDNEEYANRFKAFVWFDIIPFESIPLVDENSLKEIVIWSVLDDQMDTLNRNENGEALIPVSEVELYAARIFGPDFRFSGHESFRDVVEDLTYDYNPETQTYTAPSTGLMPDYLPTVVEVVREPGGVRRVVMGYVYTRTKDNQVVTTPDYEHPAKYMDYMLRRDGNNYYLYAVQANTTYVPATAEESSAPVSSIPEDYSLPEESSPPPSSAPESASLLPESAAEGDEAGEEEPSEDSSAQEQSTAA